MSWIIALQTKTTFCQDRPCPCPPSNLPLCGNPSRQCFRGMRTKESIKGGQGAAVERIRDRFHLPHLVRLYSPEQSQPSRSRVLHQKVARTWVNHCVSGPLPLARSCRSSPWKKSLSIGTSAPQCSNLWVIGAPILTQRHRSIWVGPLQRWYQGTC